MVEVNKHDPVEDEEVIEELTSGDSLPSMEEGVEDDSLLRVWHREVIPVPWLPLKHFLVAEERIRR